MSENPARKFPLRELKRAVRIEVEIITSVEETALDVMDEVAWAIAECCGFDAERLTITYDSDAVLTDHDGEIISA